MLGVLSSTIMNLVKLIGYIGMWAVMSLLTGGTVIVLYILFFDYHLFNLLKDLTR